MIYNEISAFESMYMQDLDEKCLIIKKQYLPNKKTFLFYSVKDMEWKYGE